MLVLKSMFRVRRRSEQVSGFKVMGAADLRFMGCESLALAYNLMYLPFTGSGGRKCCVLVGRDIKCPRSTV